MKVFNALKCIGLQIMGTLKEKIDVILIPLKKKLKDIQDIQK